MPKVARAAGSRLAAAEQAPLRLRNQGRRAPVVAGWLARQDWSALVSPRLMARSSDRLLPAGAGAARDSVPRPAVKAKPAALVVAADTPPLALRGFDSGGEIGRAHV